MVFGIILTFATTCLISSSDVYHRAVVQVLPLFLFKSTLVNCNSCLSEWLSKRNISIVKTGEFLESVGHGVTVFCGKIVELRAQINTYLSRYYVFIVQLVIIAISGSSVNNISQTRRSGHLVEIGKIPPRRKQCRPYTCGNLHWENTSNNMQSRIYVGGM